jgi:broad specificity phosphatase PhoE
MVLREVRQRFPALWQANARQDDDDFRWPGGESYREFRRRCLSAVIKLTAAHSGGSVALVTHAGFITQVVGSIRGDRPACWDRHRTGNTALTEIRWTNGSGTVMVLDDRRHLSTGRRSSLNRCLPGFRAVNSYRRPLAGSP